MVDKHALTAFPRCRNTSLIRSNRGTQALQRTTPPPRGSQRGTVPLAIGSLTCGFGDLTPRGRVFATSTVVLAFLLPCACLSVSRPALLRGLSRARVRHVLIGTFCTRPDPDNELDRGRARSINRHTHTKWHNTNKFPSAFYYFLSAVRTPNEESAMHLVSVIALLDN